MKKLLKRLELIFLVLMLGLSTVACGEEEASKTSKSEKSDKKNKDKDTEEDDEEDDDEEDEDEDDSSEEAEATPEPTAEPTPTPTAEPTPTATAEPQDETRKYDEEALKIVEESWVLMDEFFNSEDIALLEEARNKLGEINLRKCSTELRRLVEENELIINDFELIFDWSDSVIKFGEDFSQIAFDEVDISDDASLEDIEAAYYQVATVIEVCKEIEVPQFIGHAMNREIEILEKYQILLAELYWAEQNQDVLTAFSAECFTNDILTEQEEWINDIDTIMEALEVHIDVYLERVEKLMNEYMENYELLMEGDYENVEFSYLDEIEKTKVTSSISCIDTIYPAMYNRLQAVAIVNLSYVNGEKDVLVTVEVDGFSQKYEKTITVNQFPQRYYIKPPVISSGLNLDNQKNTQIKVTVADVETGNIIAAETENVKIMSINDFILSDNEYGYTNYADILAWVTPESNYIQDLLRSAADYMEEYTGYHGIPGYQYVINEDEEMITKYQVYSIQKAISDMGVRYVMSSYSIGEATNATQRVNRPDETLLSKSGICIETSVLMASALQAAGFNSMIVLTTNHCQVAVETWKGSGDYILIETTFLPIEDPYDVYGDMYYIDCLMETGTKEEWLAYLENNEGMVYSCNLATYMGITPLVY